MDAFESQLRALLRSTDAWLICGQCETDLYGEDFILVTAEVAGCPKCEALRNALAVQPAADAPKKES